MVETVSVRSGRDRTERSEVRVNVKLQWEFVGPMSFLQERSPKKVSVSLRTTFTLREFSVCVLGLSPPRNKGKTLYRSRLKVEVEGKFSSTLILKEGREGMCPW